MMSAHLIDDMVRRTKWVVLGIFTVVFLLGALAGWAAADEPSDDLMRSLMSFAEPRLGIEAPAVTPPVTQRPWCELQALVFPEGWPCPGRDEPGVLALYDSGTMFLLDDWDAGNLRDVSALLHELVHHMQHHAGVPQAPCIGVAWEKPAYEVHFAFLEAAGVDPYEITGINDLNLIWVTNCW